MGTPREPEPVLLVTGLFGNHSVAMAEAKRVLESLFGPIHATKGPFPFVETSYYEREMGKDLVYELVAFDRLIQPDWLAAIKLKTNQIEEELALSYRSQNGQGPAGRVVNIDPGYVCAGKFVLATTKDQAHRIYLGRGIFGEVTLFYERGQFRPWPWTYPNYCRDDYRAALAEFRSFYMTRRRDWLRAREPVRPLPFDV